MSDARRKQVYWATYGFIGNRLGGPEIGTPQELADRLRGTVGYVAGAGAQLYREHFADFTINEHSPYPEAAALADMVINKALKQAPSDDLAPLYLRRPDAQPPGLPKQVTPA
jgi:tRNA A37 threonylcarbamoyladenosine modification protein TsaB